MCDIVYAGGTSTSGTREYLQDGDLWNGSNAGFAYLNCRNRLDRTNWNYCSADMTQQKVEVINAEMMMDNKKETNEQEIKLKGKEAVKEFLKKSGVEVKEVDANGKDK